MGIVATKIMEAQRKGSGIRAMFEKGAELKAKHGVKNVHDFSLGNPDLEPPAAVTQRLIELTVNPLPGSHRYMSNAGYLDVRQKVADFANKNQSPKFPLTAGHILMTVGAAGALNVVFKAILDPGAEVLVPSPYFVEYGFYVENHGGKLVAVDTLDNFQLNIGAIEAAITPRTKAILINSPNNPTGVVYTREALDQLAEVIERKEKESGHPILLISDEPYTKLVYDGVKVPPVLQIFPHSVLGTSYSKDLGLPGERIGHAAVSPSMPDSQGLIDAMIFANRTLGFVNAPALMQRLVAEMQDEVVCLVEYQTRRDLLAEALGAMGYQFVRPQGAFYFFPQSPILDDVVFCRVAADEHQLLVVPGSAFGKSGHFRISFASTPGEQIERALPAFMALAIKYGLVAA